MIRNGENAMAKMEGGVKILLDIDRVLGAGEIAEMEKSR